MSSAIFVFIAISIIWVLILYLITRRSYSYKSKVIPVTILAALLVCAVGYGLILFIEMNESTESCGNCHLMKPMYDEYMGNNPLMVVHREAETEYGAVGCANCHSSASALSVVPGLVSGIMEMLQTSLNLYELPIEAHEFPRDQCLKCHNPNGLVGEYPKKMERPYWLEAEEGGRKVDGNLHRDPPRECRDCHNPHEKYTDCTASCHSKEKGDLSKSVHIWDCVFCHKSTSKEAHKSTVERDCTYCHGKLHNPEYPCIKCHGTHLIDEKSKGIGTVANGGVN